MAPNYVCVDVGGTKILATAIAENGEILARLKEKTQRDSKRRLLAQINDVTDAVLASAGIAPADMAGMAFGIPGVVRTATGEVLCTPNVPLTDTPLGSMMREHYGVPVTVSNDVNLGTLGEHWKGAARGADSVYGIFVGTGIGGGLVINGRIVEGHRGLCGEIGHLMIPLGADEIVGALDRKHIFLEDLCSRTAIENQLRHAIQVEGKTSILTDIVGDAKLRRIRSKALREALRRRDPLVTDVVRRCSYLLGLATASLLHVVDPEVIVFGGGVIEACGDWMLPWIEKTARKVAMPGTGEELKIFRSALGDDAIVMGGLALLRQLPHTQLPAHIPEPELRSTPLQPLAEVDKPLPVDG